MKIKKVIIAGVCVLGAASMLSGCKKEDDYEWVMPTTTASPDASETTTLPVVKAVTQEEAKSNLESEFLECNVTFVKEEKINDRECFVFSVKQKENYDTTKGFELLDDVYYIAKADGRTVTKEISDEKALRILGEAYEGKNMTFTKLGTTAEIYDFVYNCYSAAVIGADGTQTDYGKTVMISKTLGNEVLEGTKDASTGEWKAELIYAY